MRVGSVRLLVRLRWLVTIFFFALWQVLDVGKKKVKISYIIE
jgi:hypothetical protein